MTYRLTQLSHEQANSGFIKTEKFKNSRKQEDDLSVPTYLEFKVTTDLLAESITQRSEL